MCSELLYDRRFSLRLKGVVYGSYIRSAVLYGSEAWCLKESEMGILRRTERSMVRAMYGVQFRDIKRSTDLMFMFGLRETIDELAMANNSVRWYCHVLRREDGHVFSSALEFDVEGQRNKGWLKLTWKKQVEEESVGLRREDALCQSRWSIGVSQIAAGLR